MHDSLLTSRCINQRGAGHSVNHPSSCVISKVWLKSVVHKAWIPSTKPTEIAKLTKSDNARLVLTMLFLCIYFINIHPLKCMTDASPKYNSKPSVLAQQAPPRCQDLGLLPSGWTAEIVLCSLNSIHMTESCTYYLNSRFIVDYLLLFKTKNIIYQSIIWRD